MAFLKAGIVFLDEGDLFTGEFHLGVGTVVFQRQPAVVASAQLMLLQDLLDGDITEGNTIGSNASRRLQPYAGWVCARLLIFSTVSGGVVMGWLLAIGGRSFSPSMPWVWKRRLYS